MILIVYIEPLPGNNSHKVHIGVIAAHWPQWYYGALLGVTPPLDPIFLSGPASSGHYLDRC